MQLKTRLLGFFITTICAGAPLATTVAQEAIPAVTPPQQEVSSCTPVARLFSETVCREDITTADEHLAAIKQQYQAQGLDPEAAMQTRNMDQLKDMLWMIALRRKFEASQIEPTAEETYLYSKALKDSLRRSHQENIETAAKIKDMLAHRTYPEEEEFKLRSLLQKIETSISFYNEREAHKGKMPPEFEEMVAEAERGIAAAAVRDWKINKALYESYGGKLALHSAGPQPVEAYAKFIEFIRSEGNLEILDPAYQNVFAKMEQFAAGPHEMLSAEEEAFYKGYFSSPLWRFENQAKIHQAKAKAEAGQP